MTTRHSRSFTYRSRERIKAAKILDRLIKFVDGEVELTRQQAYVGLRLLNKVLPDLRAMALHIEPEQKRSRDMTDAELQACLDGEYEKAGYIHKDNLTVMGYQKVSTE